ncbi:MAG: HAD hydrolase-like protein [Actinobacteria bacterium]|nr:HAD hydrolase-like protein [Actinomycetota bacterium]
MAASPHVVHRHQVVLFDLDGTISDNSEGISTGMLKALNHFGINDVTATDARAVIGPPLRGVFADWGITESRLDEAVEVYRVYYRELGWKANVLYDGVAELIADLARAGRTVATATSKPDVFAEKILDRFGLIPHLAYVGAATLDATRTHKVEVVRHTLNHLAVEPSDAVMIGDRFHDVEGAREAGVEAVVGVTWGFGDRAELEAAGATTIVDTATQLRAVLGLG